MSSIADLLGKYRVQIEKKKDERGRITEILHNITGITFKPEEIIFTDTELQLAAHPAKRQIAFMQKEAILGALQAEFPNKRIFTLR